MRLVCVVTLCGLALGISGCGGGDGRLSRSAYDAAITKVGREARALRRSGERRAHAATTVAELVAALRSFADGEDKIGDEVAKLKAPSDAVAANAELAKGEHDGAASIRALLPKLSRLTTVNEVMAYLDKAPRPKGLGEQDDALSKLIRLGYRSGD